MASEMAIRGGAFTAGCDWHAAAFGQNQKVLISSERYFRFSAPTYDGGQGFGLVTQTRAG